MILCDREMQAALDAKQIFIFPPPPEELYDSTAVDLTLDKSVLFWDPEPSPAGGPLIVCPNQPNFSIKKLMQDSKWAKSTEIGPGGFTFGPEQRFILLYTREKISLPHASRIAARVEGKSSLARLGIGVHVTAPTIHAGFGYNADKTPEESAQPLQLEMFNLSGLPVQLEAGMRICQLIFEEVREAPLKGYRGVTFMEQPEFVASPPRPKKPGRQRKPKS